LSIIGCEDFRKPTNGDSREKIIKVLTGIKGGREPFIKYGFDSSKIMEIIEK